jgi:hypothetical protein
LTIKILDPNPYGPLSLERLESFEKFIQIKLPVDYREFLLQYNGGKPQPSGFWIHPYDDGDSVYQFLGLHDGPKGRSIDTCKGEELYGIPRSLLPIGDDGLGNSICLGLSESTYGEIFFLDHDEHPYHDPESPDGIIKLSNSFTEFCDSLIDHHD